MSKAGSAVSDDATKRDRAASKRILFHHRIRADDGQAVHVRELIGAMREAGHEVLECALVPKATPTDKMSLRPPSLTGRFLRHLQLPRRITEMMEIAYSKRGESMLLAAARDFKPDFIYERHALHCRSGMSAAAQLDLPLLLEVNSPMCEEMSKLGALRFPRRALRTEKEVLDGASCVLPVSQVLADILTEAGAKKTQVIRNAADPRRYSSNALGQSRQEVRGQLGLEQDDLLLGFVGYMRPWHRLDLVIEALRQPGLKKLHLVLVGEGPALPAIAAAAERLGLSERVHPVGPVAAAELPRVVCAFDMALIPAINHYASPLKLFDSLAAGVATLAPDQPNLREMIEHGQNGILFRAGDAADLARWLTALCDDRAWMAGIGNAGRRMLEEQDWTWLGNARRVVQVYDEVVG